MGEVYRADDLKLGQPVALKFLPEQLLADGASLARFHREVRIARQVSHKNVCRVYDIGETSGHHFLSMEYIKGEELSSLLRRIGRLPADKAVQLARQMCAGLAAAHDSGVLHRDLKPANVMIDAEGNARILDFGIAGLAEDFRDDELAAGTPAYMAPEQLDGSSVTTRSDIYSLGLVLYELFTGKKAFEAESLHDLIKLRRSDTTPTTPTSIVKDLDPVIEKLIDRCIQKDPTRRPSSAMQVAAALPGGDPIAAALAAGETPSPEMVAAAPKVGTLKPPVALGLFAAVIILLLIPILLSRQVATYRLIPFDKPPEVLKQQASEIAESLGYTQAPADTNYGFAGDREYYNYLIEHRASLNPWSVLKHAQPGLIKFWYRQSPGALVPYNTQFVTMKDPPSEIPGMVRMNLDTDGKLVYLEAVPDQVVAPTATTQRLIGSPSMSNSLTITEDQSGGIATVDRSSSSAGPDSSPDIQYARLFQAAGLDITQFQPVASEWTPSQPYDARQAWSGVYPQMPQVPMRVEAATYQNRPVYFQIVSPWSRPASALAVESSAERSSTWLLLGIFFSTLVIGALLALRNLRSGRGDRRGAFRVALFLFSIRMVHWVFATHHVAQSSELMLLVTGLQSALFWSCFGGMLYLALEPYLRKRWPQRIIAWSRLMAGDLRDPLIGRDILIGSVIGSLCVAMMYLRLIIPRWLGLDPGMPDVSDIFSTAVVGLSTFAQLLMNQLSAAVVQTFVIVFLLLFLSLLFRRDWLGISVGFMMLASLFVFSIAQQEHPIAVVLVALTVALMVFSAVRFGPLALFSTLAFFHLWVFFPITSEFTAWYASTFVLDLIVLLGLAIYGYYISLGGQSPFNVKLLGEQ
jgi:serine/threonine-protein kinase